jgi:hypothetical protein
VQDATEEIDDAIDPTPDQTDQEQQR